MDIEKMIAQERRGIVVHALFSGLCIAVLVVQALVGIDGWALIPAILLGARLNRIGNHSRMITWMTLVQRQDAVIEQLLTQVESAPLPEPRAKDRVDFV